MAADNDGGATGGLRERAEASLPGVTEQDRVEELSRPEVERLVHELRVHRIELELQNEELRRAQEELAVSRDRYADLYDFAPCGHLDLDEGGVIREVNSTGATLLGRERCALVGTLFAGFVAPEDRDRFHIFHRQLVGAREVSTARLRLSRAGSLPFHARLDGAPVPSAPGACRLALTDVDVATRAEERIEAIRIESRAALERSQDRFRLVFEHVPEGILLTDAETRRFVGANPAMCALLGYTAAELLELEVRDIHPPEVLAEIDGGIARQLAGRLTTAHAVPVRRKDGTVLATELVAASAEIGGRTLLLACFRDVTDRDRLLTNLAQSDRLASMGMLAAGLAHEINNPLAYVLCNLESLDADLPALTRCLGRAHDALVAQLGTERALETLGWEYEQLAADGFEDIGECLQGALGGVRRMGSLVRSLGTFSRVEPSDVGPVDVVRCMDDAVALAFNEIKYRARLVKDYSPVPPVIASEGKLAQVFLNLLVNAAQALTEGHVAKNEIRVRVWPRGDRVCVEVRDTGAGIAPDVQSRLFEPFFSTTAHGRGSGLGLPICKRIVEGFGGAISFTSDAGEGSSFRVELPRASDDRGRRRRSGAAPGAAAPRPRGRILVVDDEEEIRRVLGRLLRPEHDVVAAASGEEARELLEGDRRFDLILCDLMMPAGTGMELHAWLAQRDPELARRVVFITGGAFTSGAAEYLSRVENQRVTKPFDSRALRALVRGLVDAHQASQVGS